MEQCAADGWLGCLVAARPVVADAGGVASREWCRWRELVELWADQALVAT